MGGGTRSTKGSRRRPAGKPSRDEPSSGEEPRSEPQLPATSGGAWSRASLLAIVKGALVVVGLGAVARGLVLVIGNAMTSTMLGAVVVSLVTGRVGVVSEVGGHGAYRRATFALGLGTVAAVLATVAVVVTGAAVAAVELGSTFLFGAAESFAIAYRDELWLHGIPIAFGRRAGVRMRWIGCVAILASVATDALMPGTALDGLVLTASAASCFVVLWLTTGDAWAPVAAHFAWVWLSESLLSGELLDVVSGSGRLARGGAATGAFAWVASGAFLVIAWAIWRGRIRLGRASPAREGAPR